MCSGFAKAVGVFFESTRNRLRNLLVVAIISFVERARSTINPSILMSTNHRQHDGISRIIMVPHPAISQPVIEVALNNNDWFLHWYFGDKRVCLVWRRIVLVF